MFKLSILYVSLACMYCAHSNPESIVEQPYTIKPLSVGVEIVGLNLSQLLPYETMQQLKSDVFTHQLLLFRGQGRLNAAQHLQVAGYFGNQFFNGHPWQKGSEHPLIYRISNTEEEGSTASGNAGMHNDGFFYRNLHQFVVYHIVKAASAGETVFADCYRFLENMEPGRFARWDRLWTEVDDDDFLHPLIYQHPTTERNVLATNPMFVAGFVKDYDTDEPEYIGPGPAFDTLQLEIEYQIMKDHSRLYFHKWQEGDVIIIDNLSLVHFAEPDTQLPPEEIGLRVLNTVSILGQNRPTKARDINVNMDVEDDEQSFKNDIDGEINGSSSVENEQDGEEKLTSSQENDSMSVNDKIGGEPVKVNDKIVGDAEEVNAKIVGNAEEVNAKIVGDAEEVNAKIVGDAEEVNDNIVDSKSRKHEL